ncbi:FG-GAP-like repeat-containing protein, partial [Catenovulum maritimum]
MQKTLKLFANPLILLSFFSFTLGAANAGLPFTEDFSDQNLLDISNSSADWLTASGVGQLPQGYPILPNITLPTEVAETIGTETNWTPGVAWGDVDKDGDIDLIFVNSGQANNLYLNDGSNTFTTSATSIATDSVSSTSAVLVDVDNDTDLDLVIGNYDETNKLYYNDGTGNFDATGTLIGEHNGSWIWGDNPTEKIIAADVNKDGYIDILTANNGITGNYGTVNRIFFNDGTGSFPSNTDIDSESDNSSSIVAADFDNDGHLDLAVANYWPAPADRIYLNNGDATFSSAINLSSSDTDTYDFAVGDIDADGDLDLISASIGENQIYLNDGSANFTLLGSVSSDAVYSQSISLHDLDMDGDLDLIIGNSNATNQYFLNDGTGNFSAAVQLGSESLATHELVAVDIDKDGDLDFIAANTSGDGNRLYRNHSAGGWVKAGTDVGTESNTSTSVAVADIDGDFIPDLIIGKSGTANLVYFNDGLGGFSSSGTSIGSETDDTQDVVIADVNHDGFDDLVVANNLMTNKYYLNDGTGNFSATGTDIGSETDATQAVLVKDLNADGLVDVISIESNDTTKIYWNSGGAVFSSTGESFSTDADDSQAAILFDVDSDGELDLVVINNGLDKIYFNSGQGVFASTGTQLSNDAYNGRAVDYGDIDNDGDLDLVIANDSAADLYYLNDGSGNFSTNGGSLGSEADTSEDIKLVDFDADGDLDVIVAKSTGNLIYYNQGDATFSDSVSLDTDSSDTAALAYADFDLSGSIDIIAANSSSISKLYFNNSIGGYSSESAEISSATNNSLDAQFADFDRDGWLDLVVANDEQAMLIYFNDGFGNLSATGVDIGASTEKPQEMRIGDLDLDGDMDIVTANYNQVNKMYLNDGTGSFTAVDIGSEIEVTWGIGLADFNQDGYLDIVVSTGSGSTNKIYLNNGDGSYPVSGTDISSDTFGDGVAIVDVNQDGKLDILITGSQTYLYLGNGDGSFQSSSVIGASNSSAASVSFADLNNDTYPDMVIGYGFSGDLTNRLYLNDGTGNFPSSGTALGAHLDQTRDLDLLDIDKDGDLDIVFSNVGQTNKLHLNDGQGNFDTGSDLSSEIYDTWAIEFADVNLDGYLELVTLNAAQTNRINTINRFSPASSQISSITLNSSITDIPRAILTASETLSDHTGVEYLLSNDAGVNWYPVTSGVAFDFPNGIDGDLQWRAKLSSRSARYTPVINQLVVDFQNTEPEITSIEETTASEGVEYSYTFTATDIDVADSLTLSAPILPIWLSFDSATRVLSGTPDFSHAGSHSVTLQVSDGTDDVSQSFTIEVNVYPVITTLEETTAFEDLSYSYTIAATDSNGDSLTYSASTLPSWLSFDSGSTTLSGTPTNNEVGDHSVVLSVSDGALSVDQSFTVTVFNVNDSPVITSTEITSATEDTAYAYTFSASDDDAPDALILSAPTLPSWLNFDSSTGVLSGTPTN